MSITSKLFAMLGLTQAAREEIQREINIYEAIEAHIAWKIRLNDYLEGRSKKYCNRITSVWTTAVCWAGGYMALAKCDSVMWYCFVK